MFFSFIKDDLYFFRNSLFSIISSVLSSPLSSTMILKFFRSSSGLYQVSSSFRLSVPIIKYISFPGFCSSIMPTVIIVVTALCILIGSQITTSKIKRNGIVNGALVGAIYILALYLISSIISKDFSLNIYSIIMMATSILIGGIGGIIGVNKK